MEKLYNMAFADVYPAYVNKVERKGRTVAELDQVILWLTGYNKTKFKDLMKQKATLRDFFGNAKINPKAVLITGSICGVKIQEIEDPLMLKIRYLDKLVEELAKGRPLEKILRTA